MATDLRDNSNWRLFQKFIKGFTAVSIAGTSLAVTAIFAIIAVMAMRDANQANATAETWQIMYKETERECRLAQMEIDDFRIVLIKAGLDVDHIGEKP